MAHLHTADIETFVCMCIINLSALNKKVYFYFSLSPSPSPTVCVRACACGDQMKAVVSCPTWILRTSETCSPNYRAISLAPILYSEKLEIQKCRINMMIRPIQF